MKGLLFFMLTIFCLHVFSQQKTSVEPTKPGEMIRQEILQKIKVFSEAWGKSDTVTLGKLLATEYQHSDIWGKLLHRQDWLIYAAAARNISDMVIADEEILLYNNNIAVVTGKMSYLVGENKVSQQIRFTQIWSCNALQWKRTAFQATLIDRSK